jgi:hypothetical protein
MSECLVLKPEEIKDLEEKNKALAEKKGCGKSSAVLALIVIGSAAAFLF